MQRLLTDVTQILACFLDTFSHGLFTLSNPDTGIVELNAYETSEIHIMTRERTFLFGLSAPSGLPT